VLEGLLGERVARRVGSDEAGHLGAVQRLGSGEDVIVGLRRSKPRGIEQVRAVVEQLGPRLTGHRELFVSVLGHLESALGEGVRSEILDHCRRSFGVHQVVRTERAYLGEGDRPDHVGQVVGSRGGGQELVELVLGDTHELDVDARRRSEVGDDRLRRRDPVGERVRGPDGDGLALDRSGAGALAAVSPATPT